MKLEMEDVRQTNWPGRWFPIALVIVGLFLLGFRELWVYLHVEQSNRLATTLSRQLSFWVEGEKAIEQSYFRSLVAKEPRIGYLALLQLEDNRRTGFINPSALERAGENLGPLLKESSTQKALSMVIESNGFPGPYLESYTILYTDQNEGANQVPKGKVQLGYVMPGFPFGRGYHRVLLAIELGLCVLTLFWFFGALILRSKRSKTPAFKESFSEEDPPEGLDLLEMELDQSTLRMEVDEKGDSWRILFNEDDLDDWDMKGEWHISDRTVIGQPWGACITRTDLSLEGSYRFKFQGRKLSGRDGILVLFQVGKKNLTWVVGGWDNAYSSVGGYENTKRSFSMGKLQWHDFEVRVGKSEVEGFVNGKSLWKLSRAEIIDSSPEIGLKNGLGVGVWNAIARFKEFRFTMV